MLQVIVEGTASFTVRLAHSVNHAFEALVSKDVLKGGECCFRSCPKRIEYLEITQTYLNKEEKAAVDWAKKHGLVS